MMDLPHASTREKIRSASDTTLPLTSALVCTWPVLDLSFITSISNIFDQDLNTTNNVTFYNITATENITATLVMGTNQTFFNQLIANAFSWITNSVSTLTNYYTKTEVNTNITNANTSLKNYVDSLDASFNTSIQVYVDGKDVSVNTTLKNYVDAKDTSFNTSLKDYADGTFLTTQSNIFDQNLNTTNNVTFYNATITDNMTITNCIIFNSGGRICSGV